MHRMNLLYYIVLVSEGDTHPNIGRATKLHELSILAQYLTYIVSCVVLSCRLPVACVLQHSRKIPTASSATNASITTCCAEHSSERDSHASIILDLHSELCCVVLQAASRVCAAALEENPNGVERNKRIHHHLLRRAQQ